MSLRCERCLAYVTLGPVTGSGGIGLNSTSVCCSSELFFLGEILWETDLAGSSSSSLSGLPVLELEDSTLICRILDRFRGESRASTSLRRDLEGVNEAGGPSET